MDHLHGDACVHITTFPRAKEILLLFRYRSCFTRIANELARLERHKVSRFKDFGRIRFDESGSATNLPTRSQMGLAHDWVTASDPIRNPSRVTSKHVSRCGRRTGGIRCCWLGGGKRISTSVLAAGSGEVADLWRLNAQENCFASSLSSIYSPRCRQEPWNRF